MFNRTFATAAVLAAGLAVGAQAQSLKDAFKGAFVVGSAVNPAQTSERDAAGAALIKAQFNTITPENILKWERVHPALDKYEFGPSDEYVAFGEKNKMFIVGHCLVWHSQTPRWVFQDDKGAPLTRDALLKRMQEHIQTVVGRYKGRINGWDVVNEALNEDGTMRQSQWQRIIGDDFIIKAFQFAHEADPKAELYYNDYNAEKDTKLKGVIEIVKKLKAAGVPITAVGMQDHEKMDWPSVAEHDAAIAAMKALGVKVAITELDIDLLPAVTRGPTADVNTRGQATANSNPYAAGLPDEMQQKLAKRYADLFAVYLKYKGTVTRVTFWGATDADSWLNGWPVPGRTAYPLLFDRQHKPKPAFDAVMKVAAGK